jgi:hypothetical protein
MNTRRDVYTRYSAVDGARTPIGSSTEMLRAENNLSYREFIACVKQFWENIHPDVCIVPTQSGAFAKYPCISYSLDLRRSHPSEPKSRYREEIIGDDGSIYSIYGHRLQNIIAFSAITRSDPHLAEAIIEEFELFMDEYVGALKELGASEIVFSRRMSDREENRTNEDINIRTAVYLVTLERLNFVEEAKLLSIKADVRTYLEYQRVPSFEVTGAQVGTNEITILQKNVAINVGDKILLKSIDNSFFTYPLGITDGFVFAVESVEEDTFVSPSVLTVTLTNLTSGVPIVFTTPGKGVWIHTTADNVGVSIVDQQAAGATPSY